MLNALSNMEFYKSLQKQLNFVQNSNMKFACGNELKELTLRLASDVHSNNVPINFVPCEKLEPDKNIHVFRLVLFKK